MFKLSRRFCYFFLIFAIYATLTSCCPFFSFTGSFSQTNTVSHNINPTCFHRNVAFLGKDFFSAETKQFNTGTSIRWWTQWDKRGNWEDISNIENLTFQVILTGKIFENWLLCVLQSNHLFCEKLKLASKVNQARKKSLRYFQAQ